MSSVLFALVITIPYQLLGYFPFWRDHLRFSRKNTFLFLSLLILLKCACFYAAADSYGILRLLEFAFGAVHLTVFLYLVHLQPGKVLFIYFFLIAYLSMNQGFANILQVWLFYAPDMNFSGYANSFLNLGVLSVTMPCAFLLFRRTCQEIANAREKYIISYYWLIPALTVTSSVVYNIRLTPETVQSPAFLISRLTLLACAVAEYIILIRALEEARALTVSEERAGAAEQLAAVRSEQYVLLKDRIEDARRARHDLRQHLALIRRYIEHGEKDALAAYIDAYGQSVQDGGDLLYCENYAVDTIARFYIEQAKAEGIRADVSLPLPKELPFPEPDLCILVGNLLENALTACRLMASSPSGTDRERYIRVRGLFTPPDGLSLTVDNSFLPNTSPRKKPANYDSPGLGLGLSSIRSIAARFGGTACFEQTPQEFRAAVLLYGGHKTSSSNVTTMN